MDVHIYCINFDFQNCPCSVSIHVITNRPEQSALQLAEEKYIDMVNNNPIKEITILYQGGRTEKVSMYNYTMAITRIHTYSDRSSVIDLPSKN